jgi:hypothetical protein
MSKRQVKRPRTPSVQQRAAKGLAASRSWVRPHSDTRLPAASWWPRLVTPGGCHSA